MMLQSKFEQDKKRMLQLRAARKFRPYWTLHSRKQGQQLKHQKDYSLIIVASKFCSKNNIRQRNKWVDLARHTIFMVKMVALAFPGNLHINRITSCCALSHPWHYEQPNILLLEETSPFPFQASFYIKALGLTIREFSNPSQKCLKCVYTVFLGCGRHIPSFFVSQLSPPHFIKFIVWFHLLFFQNMTTLLALLPGSSLAAWHFLLISNAFPLQNKKPNILLLPRKKKKKKGKARDAF